MTAPRLLAVTAIAAILAGSAPARAAVTVELSYPREVFRVGSVTEFVTNDPVLPIAGEIVSGGEPWVLVVTAPAGVPAMSAGYPAPTEVTLDLGAPATVTEVLFTPVVEREGGAIRSYGVREFMLSTSLDGGAYSSEVALTSGSGVAATDDRARVPLPEAREARFVRLRWVSGWQLGAGGLPDIRLERVQLSTHSSDAATVTVSRFASVVRTPPARLPFAYEVLLHEGRNRVVLQVVELDGGVGDVGSSDSATIAATLLPELPVSGGDSEDPPTVLSDGANLAVAITAGAAPETLRGFSLTRLDPRDVPVATYRTNADIDASYPPVLAYDFTGRFQEPFQAVSTAALPGQPPSLAVDGRFDFPSTWVSDLAPFPITWRVDLRAEADVARVVIHPRVEDGLSFGPQRASVLFSRDNDVFAVAAELEEFPDGVATIVVSDPTPARYVELVIEEGKQANNIQINEIEFFTATGSRVLAQVTSDTVSFREPVVVNTRYFDDDLVAAGAPLDAPVGIFLWNQDAWEWQWTRAAATEAALLSPGARAGGGGLFAVDANSLSKLALFVRSDSTDDAEVVAAWSFNPFSPNGDGIADTTRLSIKLTGDPDGAGAEVSVHISDLRGMLVASPADGTFTTSGAVTVDWDGRDRNGRAVPIGAYIYEARVRPFATGARPVVANGVIAVAK